MDVSADRTVSLRLTFNHEPDRSQLTRFFHLSAEGQGEVQYWLMGAMGSNAVLVETAPVLAEELAYTLEPGLPAAGGVFKPEDALRQGRLLRYSTGEAPNRSARAGKVRSRQSGTTDIISRSFVACIRTQWVDRCCL